MPELTLQQAFDRAIQLHRSGNLAGAESIYRQVLAKQPNNADALHLLGVIAHQCKKNEQAVELINRAIAVKPSQSDFYSNLGIALMALQKFDDAKIALQKAIEFQPHSAVGHFNLGLVFQHKNNPQSAIEEFRKALSINPQMLEAHNNLGNSLRSIGQLQEAADSYQAAIKINPNHPESYNNLGLLLQNAGQLEQAQAEFQRAIRLNPNFPEVHYNLALLLGQRGQPQQAVAAFREALRINPNHYDVQNDYALMLQNLGQVEPAIAAYRRAIEIKPDFAEAHYNLANAYKESRRHEEAIASYETAIKLKPTLAAAHNNLGNVFKDLGDIDRAIEGYRRAAELRPDNVVPHSNLIYTLHFHPDYDSQKINEEHASWNRRHADPIRGRYAKHENDRDPDRKLKIAYLSPDFYQQAEAFFVVPLLEAHDHSQFEVHCYASVRKPDQVTQRLRKSADVWHDVLKLSDGTLAEKILSDKIDVLIDLTMHMAANRMRTLASQPAPVQVNWLAYPGTAGLDAVQYRLTDAHMEPIGQDDSWSAEKPVRLPDSWCCYDPIVNFPPVTDLPALSNGKVMFGSLNNICKFNDKVMALWSRVLHAVPNSTLRLLCPVGRPHTRIRAAFESHGIAPDRIELITSKVRFEYLMAYQSIDICLDPFPYNGITTTCDAMLMGVPVVTMPGKIPASRAGLSLLSTVALPELIAKSEDDYIKIAAELAGDLPRLTDLRKALRRRLQSSPLMDGPRSARNVEAAYRTMWRSWCEK